MNYQTFIQELPNLYHNWGNAQITPKNHVFQEIVNQLQSETTANVLQLINLAIKYLEDGQIGCGSGSNLIAALFNHPEQIVYAIDDNNDSAFLDNLTYNLSLFNLDDQVLFFNQNAEDFFTELQQFDEQPQIGVYFLNKQDNYRSQLLSLLLVKPFLADQALIIVQGKSSYVQQTILDFITVNHQADLLLELPIFGHGLYILNWNNQQKVNYTIAEIKKQFSLAHFQETIEKFTQDFETNYRTKTLEKLEKEALGFHYNHQFKQAEIKYENILAWDRNNAQAYHNLGMVYYQQEQWENALKFVLKSLELSTGEGLYYYSLGLILEKIGDVGAAIASYHQAIDINPQLINAYNNLGNILGQIGELTAAKTVYEQAIKNHPDHFGSYMNLGNILMQQNQINLAIDIYQKAIEINPNMADTYYNLAKAFAANNNQEKSAFYLGKYAYMQGDYPQAIINYEKIINEVSEPNLYLQLAQCYKNIKNQEKTINIYQKAIKKYPEEVKFYLWLLLELQNFDCITEAIALADKALQLFPDNLALSLEKQKILPVIYRDIEEIDFYRQRFIQELEKIINNIKLETDEQKKQALLSLDFRTNFYLDYQGKNSLKIAKIYGDLVHKIMKANYPNWDENKSLPPLTKDGKIKIGYVSHSLKGHVVGSLFLGWFKHHNHQQFEVYSYYTDYEQDARTKQFILYSDLFRHIPNNLSEICQQIIDDQLHILVFLDIGMSPLITQIAGLKLAPIQCQTWGHPITSGLPTMDYFLTGDLMESENGQEHYTEKLIRLPNIGICFPKPEVPELTKNRSDLGIKENAIIYLCCQSLYKYLPQYDYIFAAIAQQVPNCQFVFLKSPISESITDKYRQRLTKSFAKFGLEMSDYCLFLPQMLKKDYLMLNLLSDVFLDSLAWSGGHTTLEAIACQLPVVTCPGEFMRGRHSYGILKMLDVTETIAENETEYINIAVRLGLDKQWRKTLVEKIGQNHHNLYDDVSCVRELEKFYQSLINI
jgi:protein O-GlcNAc transferase